MRVLMPERILSHHVGGNTTYARRIAEGLKNHGVEVGLIPAGSNPAATLMSESFAAVRRGRSDDVLHYVADTGPLIRTRRPSLVTVHGVASLWIDVARNWRNEKIWRTRVARAISSTRSVLTVSQSSARDISQVFDIPIQDISVIRHGIDVEKFSIPRRLSPDVAQQLPSEYVLYLGNIEPRKNLLALIDAFQLPIIKSFGLPLVIAGRAAWDYESVLKRISEVNNVIRLGFVGDDDRVALMQKCSLFVFPSHYEGFGFPVLEALAAGAPVASTRRGSLDEVAGPSFELPGTGVSEIADGLETLLSDSSLLNTSRDVDLKWVKKFSWQESIDAHISAYRKVVSQ